MDQPLQRSSQSTLLRNDSTEQLLEETVSGLAELLQRDNSTSWDKAGFYLDAYGRLREEPIFAGLRGNALSRAINRRLRQTASERSLPFPPLSWLSHALKMDETWPELFAVNGKKLPYGAYSDIAVCALPRPDKDQLRTDAERNQPTQAELREIIRTAVDAYNGIYKPDFKLKVGNFWKFDSPHNNGDYGGIHPELIANLLFWFTEPGDTVIDPMAGSGLLADTLGMFRFFQETYEAEGSGPRMGHMSDREPSRPDIRQADAIMALPFTDAHFAIIDPPYLRIADGKRYRNIGDDLESWLGSLARIISNTAKCLRPGGALAVITDDVLRKEEHVPISHLVSGLIKNAGLMAHATIYNHNPNYVYSMGPAQMKAARKARLLCNGCKIIQVARKHCLPSQEPA
jgi:hypothetical protein